MLAFWMQVWPNEWKSGSVASAVSSCATGRSFGSTTAQFTNRFECVSSAPFGLPVVPDVYRITAVSVGSVGVDRVDRRRLRELRDRVGPLPAAQTTGTPAAAAPAFAGASNSGWANKSCAPESSRWYCTSGPRAARSAERPCSPRRGCRSSAA
jgi:hypothetical protein